MRFQLTRLAACLMLAPLTAMAELPAYTPVSDARLTNPEPANWLMYRANYAGWGYSPLEKINDKNVSKLTLAWSYVTGMTEGHQAPPIVNNGYMYVTTPNNQVIAFEARAARSCGATRSRSPRSCSSCIRPTAASRSTRTSSTFPPPTRCWSRWTR